MRALATAVIAFSLSLSAPALAAPCDGFVDVDSTATYCAAVTFVKSRGITLGCTDASHYCPNDSVSRAQMALFLYRLGFQNTLLAGGNAFGATAVFGTTDNNAVEINVNGGRVMRYEPNATSPNVIGGHGANNATAGVYGAAISGGGASGTVTASADCSSPTGAPCDNRVTDAFGTIGGGAGNQAGNATGTTTDATFATVAGGLGNTASGVSSVVAGGVYNTASANQGAVGGGNRNIASGHFSTVAGGLINTAGGVNSSVAGGYNNGAGGDYSIVAGGYENAASGYASAVAGGQFNQASGAYSFAAGRNAQAIQDGCFVWADDSITDPIGCFANTFVVRAFGGVAMATGGSNPNYTGARLAAGSGSWSSFSDRNGKENIEAADVGEVLAKVVSMPVATWNWKSQPATIRHMGPMAQDFHAAFGLGEDDKHITTVDTEGVALAAIQGLYQLVRDKDREITDLKARISQVESLRGELAALRSALAELREDRSSVTVAGKR